MPCQRFFIDAQFTQMLWASVFCFRLYSVNCSLIFADVQMKLTQSPFPRFPSQRRTAESQPSASRLIKFTRGSQCSALRAKSPPERHDACRTQDRAAREARDNCTACEDGLRLGAEEKSYEAARAKLSVHNGHGTQGQLHNSVKCVH